ncbi:hypothetical protein Tco_0823503 [Tanacetum coccineum]|uniref:Uncharacterized protein n=1 Tax=Tanacetum coccineum TaxID=301880 RepID=A0ABQ5AN29_9ASTR
MKFLKKNDAKPPISADTFGSNGGNGSETPSPETPAKEIVDNGIETEVVAGLPEEFQEGDMVNALSRVELKSSRNWKELDNESEDRNVERDAKREGEPTILATFGSDQGITIWDRRIKSAFQDNTLRAKWFRRSGECYALSLGMFECLTICLGMSLCRIRKVSLFRNVFVDTKIRHLFLLQHQKLQLEVALEVASEAVRETTTTADTVAKIEETGEFYTSESEEHGTKPKKGKSNDDGFK